MKREWRFLSFRWWLVHFVGMAVVYTAGRLAKIYLGG